MFKRIDASQFLIKNLERLSTALAKQRGLPIIVGLALFVIGTILGFINLGVASGVLAFFVLLFKDLGVIVAIIGLMLAQPLGE
jgi:hypothetical protein